MQAKHAFLRKQTSFAPQRVCFIALFVDRRKLQKFEGRLAVEIEGTEGEIKDIWNQNVVNILFLVVKSLKVTSGFISKLMKKIPDGATIEIFDI